jgi:hypothetical protein
MERQARNGVADARVKEVRDAIVLWRRTRERRTAMPAELWVKAVSLARTRGTYRVARALRVDYASLARRVAEAGGKRTSETHGSGFIEPLGADLFSGAVFVFRSKRGTAIKLLVCDGQGFWLCHKRLSEGRFRWWPSRSDGAAAPQRTHELAVLLSAGDPSWTQAAPEWRRVATAG